MIDDGITVVVAAGNSSQNSCSFSPARVPTAITVAASEIDDDDANYSNFGACNDLFAPGTGILSAGIASDISVDDEERYLDGIAARCGCGGVGPAVQSAGDASAGLGRDRRGDDQGHADRVLWRSRQALAHRHPVGDTSARDADADGGTVGYWLRHRRVRTSRHLVWNELCHDLRPTRRSS